MNRTYQTLEQIAADHTYARMLIIETPSGKRYHWKKGDGLILGKFCLIATIE